MPTSQQLAAIALYAEKADPARFAEIMAYWRDCLNHTGTYNPIADAPERTIAKLNPTDLKLLIIDLKSCV